MISPVIMIAISELIFAYPLLFVIIRMQADAGTTTKNREFIGIRDCVRKIHKTEGISAFYRGFKVCMSGCFFKYGLSHFIQEETLCSMKQGGVEPDFVQQFLIGTSAYFMTSPLAYPFELITRRIMVQQGRREKLFNSGYQCYKWTKRNEGFRGFYRGYFSHQNYKNEWFIN
eukprot:403359055